MSKLIYAIATTGLIIISSFSVNNKERKVTETVSITEIELETIKKEELDSKLIKIKDIEDKKEYFLAYKELIKEYSEWCEIPKTIYDVFTEEEINLICRVVETEVYQRSFDSRTNVASVVLNRFNSGKFGDTITKVVTKPHQFAYCRENITEDTILAVEYAFEIGDTAQGALFFHSFKEPRKTFCGANYIFSDDAVHHFYK